MAVQTLCLLKSPFLLRQLMLRAAMDTLLGHDFGAALAPPDPANVGAFARRAPARSAGVTAPAAGAATQPASTAREDRPVALGRALPHLVRMANGTRDRQAGDRHRLAPTGLPTLVDLEEPPPPGAPDRAGRRPCVDSHDVTGKPALGRASDSWRTDETRDRRLSGDRREIHGAPAPTSFADVAHLLAESHRPDRGGRFLRGPDRDLPPRVRLGAPRPRSAAHPARSGHRTSDGGVD